MTKFREEIIGGCRLIYGDALEVLPTLGRVDAVITSPPYDDMRDYDVSFTSFDWPLAVELVSESVDDGGVIVWNVADQHVNGSETGTSMMQALAFMEHGLNLHDTMIYAKPSFSFPESNRYPQTWEYMFVFSNGKPRTFNPIKDRKNIYSGTVVRGTQRQKDGSTLPATGSGKILSDFGIRHNVWNINNRVADNTGEHPAPFPYSLAHDHILTWTNPHETILDPFAGSFTTGVACAKMGRKFIGIEICEKYYEIGLRRIEEAYRQGDFLRDILKQKAPEPVQEGLLLENTP